MLVGMVALTGQWWLDSRKFKKADVAAHLVNLAWNGLAGLEAKPTLRTPTATRRPDPPVASRPQRAGRLRPGSRALGDGEDAAEREDRADGWRG